MSGKSPGPEPLAEHLRRRIAHTGTIGFDEFMAAALYGPGGYYATGAPRTGKRGDFFTSVSVGPVFGRLLAAQFAEMWDALGRPDDFTLVEQGAADGQLMADVLAAWPSAPPRAIIVEPLPSLRDLQQQTLAPWSERLTHVAHEDDLPPFTGVFFANELLDAFPVKLLAREGGAWRERRVGLEGEKFVFVEMPAPDPVLPVPPGCGRFAAEVRPSLDPWMRAVAEKLRRGWMLLVDYGYPESARYHPARAAGTLAAYRDHARQDDPLASPGAQDLTAHVDFTAVAWAAENAGLRLAGFADQHHALAALAALAFPPMASAPLGPEAAKDMLALRQLLHPETMGTQFKFLALAKNAAAPLAAFRFARDARQELFS